MSYPYSAESRLDAPHAYMYAPYGGAAFLADYISDRRARLCAHGKTVALSADAALEPRLAEAAFALAGTPSAIEAFSQSERTDLQSLLAALLYSLARGEIERCRPWLARAIQRFEVSKKLYAFYAPGFRKGEGDAQAPARYAELALCLAMAHARSGHLQYLSTLLKLLDLLLSLDVEAVRQGCPPELLQLLVEAELVAVRRLAATHGVSIHAD